MTTENIMVLVILGITVALFLSEKLPVDVIALCLMVALPWLDLVTVSEALAGLASNAVVSIIAVMILGYGIDQSGVMATLIKPILTLAGNSQKRLLLVITSTVGCLSAFIQNIGAAALFLPAVLRISKQQGLSVSHLLMPMGFAAILGGTLTMVASGPLIILNDLLDQQGQTPYNLFAVTPLGLMLLAAGIITFWVLGPRILPKHGATQEESPQNAIAAAWGLSTSYHRVAVTEKSRLVNKHLEDIKLWDAYNLHCLVIKEDDEIQISPWRFTHFSAGQELILLGNTSNVERLINEFDLERLSCKGTLYRDLESGVAAGFAELVIKPHAGMIGKTMREIALRKHYGVEPLVLISGGQEIHSDFSDQPLGPGDIMVVHGYWSRLQAIKNKNDIALITQIDQELPDSMIQVIASLCFLGAISLALMGFPLSISLLTGALAMVLFKVIPMEAAYKAVDWRTVFLLAGLIPLGVAMDKSGTAELITSSLASLLDGQSVLVILMVVALLATLLSLFMSNVAATVVLAPLVMIFGADAGMSGRGLALLVAICASNSFILPTHQVNALLMGPGGYRNKDYLKAGGLMTIVFLIISVLFTYAFYM